MALPPSPRVSSIVSSPRKFCSTTSVEYFSAPSLSVHLRVCSEPSTYTFEPLRRYFSATSARFLLKITTRCHSVFSLRSPLDLSRQVSEVAMDRFTTASPDCMRRTSGSLPRLPTKITLLTLPAIVLAFRTDRRGPYRFGPVCRYRWFICSLYVPKSIPSKMPFRSKRLLDQRHQLHRAEDA